MSIIFERGSPTVSLTADDFREAIEAILEHFQGLRRVLAIPPDHTRIDSRAGEFVSVLWKRLGDRLVDVMPALGTHHAMTPERLSRMFPEVPLNLFREHRWRTDVQDLGKVPSEFVEEVTEGCYRFDWTAQVNRLLLEGRHDLILSIGQVVPHEVIGMANYNKNIFVGVGGKDGIDHSHYLSALYGMERIMGRCDTPLRRILNYASEHFCSALPIVYVQTVIEATVSGEKHLRGIFVGSDHDVFWKAGDLAAQVNCFRLDEAPEIMVVWMDPKKYATTWLANKAIYRCRMAVANGGTICVVSPGVEAFGEDSAVDLLIRRYGYRTTPEVVAMVRDNDDLRTSLSAAAHLIHGSPENRFQVVYAPGKLTRSEVESVGYQYESIENIYRRFPIDTMRDGWNVSASGERCYVVTEPGLGLWMHKNHPHSI